MEKQTQEVETSFNQLYNYFYSLNTKCSNHSSRAIYFCSEETCDKSYICSECLIEDPEHFARHYKYLIPVDDKRKFYKYLNFPLDNVVKQLTPSKKQINIDEFYEQIKQKICSIIDEHKTKNCLQLKEEMNNKSNSNIDEQQSNYQKLSNMINEFIANDNKHEIQKLVRSLDQETNLIAKSFEQDTSEIDDDFLRTKIKELIDEIIRNCFGIQVNNITENKLESLNSKIKGSLNLNFDFAENSNDNKIINISEDKEKEKKEENGDVGKRLETIHEEIENGNNDENTDIERIEHAKNIKSRLEMLKQKINSIKKQ